jgi:hypothetical protein
MKPFFLLYENSTASYVPDIAAGVPAALRSHNDLFAIIRRLREHPDTRRGELTAIHFKSTLANKVEPTASDQRRAFNLALRVMTTMAACSSESGSGSADILESGAQPTPWKDDMSWTQFLVTAFPLINSNTSFPDNEVNTPFSRSHELVTARRLMKKAQLRFVPTDELRDHLKLNQVDGTVKLYHHTAFLKESLIASQKSTR